MRLDALASMPHYCDHLGPILRRAALDGFECRIYPTSHDTAQRCRQAGLTVGHGTIPDRGPPVLIAGAVDLLAVGRRGAILVEHGAGQSYRDLDHPSWAGGHSRDAVRLYVVTRQSVADLNLDRYPHARAVIASPRVHELQSLRSPAPEGWPVLIRRWDCTLISETRSAWAWYQPYADDYVTTGPGRLHCHPRIAHAYRKSPARQVRAWEDVIRHAGVVVADNTSATWEAVACGIPVVLLDAPWYRPEVEHGLRFWEHADVGPRIQQRSDLHDAIAEALADTPTARAQRARVAALVYEQPADPAGVVVAAIADLL